MRVLLDTCVLSELRHPQGDVRVRQTVADLDSEQLFVSAVSIGEIVKEISLLEDGQRQRELQSWVQTLERDYADRILAIDLETIRLWGELTAAAQKVGKILPAVAGLIASTARRHGLYVMTRNATHFEPTGALLLNPWGRPG